MSGTPSENSRPLESELSNHDRASNAGAPSLLEYGAGGDPEKASLEIDLAKDTLPTTEQNHDDSNIVSWDSLDDPENPLNWPTWIRWTLICLVSAMTLMTGLSSSMFAPSIPALLDEFGSKSTILGSLVVTIFVLGLATGPLFFAPLSELYGRTYVQHTGCIGFLIFTIACAVSTDLNMLIGMRLLQGMFAAVPLTNGGGIIADMIKQEERGFAMGLFTTGTLLGPIIGPVAGALLSSVKSWRWIFYVIAMLLGVMTCLCGFLWKETYAPVLLARKAARLRKETGNQNLRSIYDQGLSPRIYFLRGIIRPVYMLMFSPILAALCLHMGLAYAYFYLLFTTFTDIFTNNYQWEFKLVGLSFLGVGFGFLVGQMIFAKLSDKILTVLAKKGKGDMMPEYRLPLGCIGGIFVPLGFFWYGWSAQAKIHWIVPIIGTAIIGLGNSLIFISIQAYTIDAFTLYAASGLAANTVVRSIMAALIPLAAPKLYAVLGLGWGNSLLAFLAVAMVPVPVLLFFYGERMRGWNLERLNRL